MAEIKQIQENWVENFGNFLFFIDVFLCLNLILHPQHFWINQFFISHKFVLRSHILIFSHFCLWGWNFHFFDKNGLILINTQSNFNRFIIFHAFIIELFISILINKILWKYIKLFFFHHFKFGGYFRKTTEFRPNNIIFNRIIKSKFIDVYLIRYWTVSCNWYL